jgi:deoxyribodipyrimidine photo-lyase
MNCLPHFPATRGDALSRLAEFVPNAGSAYAMGRNTDLGPKQPSAVSKLSPYVRYRLLTEQEIVAAVCANHSLESAEKYVQEVLWRTYWKGWLEMRPFIWARFIEERNRQREAVADPCAIADAEAGRTGIEGFDDWARELVETGYLHNHARMWFASIWIFTLRLPWALGADFFLRHLIDADAASNTLSWRWVAGLQTVGKTYLATAENIERCTNGRFAPVGLAKEAFTITEAPVAAAQLIPETAPYDGNKPALLLVTHEDMNPGSLFSGDTTVVSAVIAVDADLLWGDAARTFAREAAADTAARVAAHFGCPAAITETLNAEALIAAANAANVRHIITPYSPVGQAAEALASLAPVLANEGIGLAQIRREWDASFWPHAKKGFFPFKEQIPSLLGELGLVWS